MNLSVGITQILLAQSMHPRRPMDVSPYTDESLVDRVSDILNGLAIDAASVRAEFEIFKALAAPFDAAQTGYRLAVAELVPDAISLNCDRAVGWTTQGRSVVDASRNFTLKRLDEKSLAIAWRLMQVATARQEEDMAETRDADRAASEP